MKHLALPLPLLALVIVVVPSAVAIHITRQPRAEQAGAVATSPVTVRAREGRGAPGIDLEEGRLVPARYSGEPALVAALVEAVARPLALVADDFDEDGVEDLVCAYGYGSEGIVALHRGNVGALWPNAREARTRRALGTFTDAPFLPDAHVTGLPVVPDFAGTGDFDGDGNRDVVVAAEGDGALHMLAGDGRGGLAPARRVALPGPVTAMVTGEMNRRDGLAEVVVAVAGASGARALVFEGPTGALRAEPEATALPEPARSLALGDVAGGADVDLVAAAGRELIVVRGRDRRLSVDAEARASVGAAVVKRYPCEVEVEAVAVGDLLDDDGYAPEVAALGADGRVRYLDCAPGRAASPARWSAVESLAGAPRFAGESRAALVRANLSGDAAHELAVIGGGEDRMRIVRAAAIGAKAEVTELETVGGAAAVLPMRLNPDGLDDLVVLTANGRGPAAVLTRRAQFLVTTTNDSGAGSLREAIQMANQRPGADTIAFDLPGDAPYTIDLTSPLPAVTPEGGPLTIDGTTQIGFERNPIVELNGENAGDAHGLTLFANDCVIRGLIVNRFESDGIFATGSNTRVERNFVGTDATGMVARGNGRNGVGLNSVGGIVTSENVISGNGAHGLSVDTPATDVRVEGSKIGVGVDGSTPVPNLLLGIAGFRSPRLTVGGVTTGAPNVISSNQVGGVAVANSDALIQGNLIGVTSANGAAGNLGDGIVSGAGGTITVGGTAPEARNVISANAGSGVVADTGASGCTIQGNLIGTDVEGASAMPNEEHGVFVRDPLGHTVGGDAQGAGNVVGGNRLFGVVVGNPSLDRVDGVRNVVRGNFIGTNSQQDAPLGNGQGGVFCFGFGNDGARILLNTVAFNGVGVLVKDGSRFLIGQNSIHSNSRLGIDLGDDEVTANDAGDADRGDNDLQNFPELVSAVRGGGMTKIAGTLNSTPSRPYVVELFANDECDPSNFGEGQTFLTSTEVSTDAAGNAKFEVEVAGDTFDHITSTARERVFGITSEFSECIRVRKTVTVTNTSDSGAGSLRNAVQTVNADPSIRSIGFNIPGQAPHTIRPQSPLPPVSAPVEIDGTTQPGYAGTPVIEIDGSRAGANADGLRLLGNANVCGLAINSFSGNGVEITGPSGNNLVEGNFIGTDVTGTQDRGNGGDGVKIDNSPDNVVRDNTISGNGQNGVRVCNRGARSNALLGNLIGTDFSGTRPLGNSGEGVRNENAPNTQIGSPSAGTSNVIGANGDGASIVGVDSTDVTFVDNFVGTDPTCSIDLSNRGAGVGFAGGASRHVVRGNVFAGGRFGVIAFPGSRRIAIEENAFIGQVVLPVDLNLDGPTANDPGDADSGANDLLNHPTIEQDPANPRRFKIAVDASPIPVDRVQVHYQYFANPNDAFPNRPVFGLLQQFQLPQGAGGATSLTVDLDFDLPAGTSVAATAIDAERNTSEYSPPVSVAGRAAAPDLRVTFSDFAIGACDDLFRIEARLTNVGTTPALGARFSLQLPGYTTNVSATGGPSVPTVVGPGRVDMKLGVIPPGTAGSVPVQIFGRLGGTLEGSFEAMAWVAAPGDTNSANDTAAGEAEVRCGGRIDSIEVRGRKLIVTGVGLERGSTIVVNGLDQTTKAKGSSGTTLVGKGVGRTIQPGDVVFVRTPDGRLTNPVVFTGLERRAPDG